MKKISIIIILLFTFSTIELYSQVKQTPDKFKGFRKFDFFTTITDYSDYNYKLIENKDNKTIYEIVLPYNESQFLETHIKKIIIEQYKEKICKITLLLGSDIKEILSNMFKDSHSQYVELGGTRISTHTPRYDHIIIYLNSYDEWDETNPLSRGGSEWKEPKIKTYLTEKLYFQGYNTNMEYGEYEIIQRSSVKDVEIGSYITYKRESQTILDAYYLTFSAEDYKNKIDSKQVQGHYDTYLSDFGVENHPKQNDEKLIYTIPLFENNNTYYVRALFVDVVENFLFDTGADQLIISKNLYNKLKSKNLVTDKNTISKMVIANGNTVELKKVIIKGLQINDLKVNFIEAYVNTSNDISLLGQSFFKRFGGISVDYKLNILTIKKTDNGKRISTKRKTDKNNRKSK